jgi:hypothetical protein
MAAVYEGAASGLASAVFAAARNCAGVALVSREKRRVKSGWS